MKIDTRIAELEELVSQLRAQLEIALAQNRVLAEQNQELAAQVQQLQVRLAKDSHNSSKPPSSDPLGRKRPRSQRQRSGKKPSGQLGHRSETLHPVTTPDEVEEHRPAVCTMC